MLMPSAERRGNEKKFEPASASKFTFDREKVNVHRVDRILLLVYCVHSHMSALFLVTLAA